MADDSPFDPVTYLGDIREEIPAYDDFQAAIARATAGEGVRRVLELGVGTGMTTQSVLGVHPVAQLVGIDESPVMLAAAAQRVGGADLRVGRLQDPLPDGDFDLVVSALTIHHLDGAGKADLFARVAERLRPGGRFVLGDLVVPVDPADVVAPVDGVYDQPSSIAEQLDWLADAGFRAEVVWEHKDLAVFVADRPAVPRSG